ncbi:MAG: peptide chain release factor N(5)-glutamine methyltransferase [bacterium]|nr:peptide chain release factor N(5)-glutamine methyltransferase [bacterium]
MDDTLNDQPDPTVHGALKWAAAQLQHLPNPDLESELMLEFVAGEERLWLVTNLDHILDKSQADRYITIVNERAGGQPLSYITGQKEFYGRSFKTTPEALIPRPESEVLINQIKTIVQRKANPKILDVGTGSGCLAVTLACELPAAQLKATDISPEALKVARANAEQHKVADRILFLEQNLLLDETDHYDVIVTNLPYVEDHWLAASPQAKELAAEPRLALSGGETGLELIEEFLRQFALKRSAPVVLLEHGDEQEQILVPFAKKLLPEAHIRSVQDQFGVNRVISISINE